MSNKDVSQPNLEKIRASLFKKFEKLDSEIEALYLSEDKSGRDEKKLRARQDFFYKVVKSLVDIAATQNALGIGTDQIEKDVFLRFTRIMLKIQREEREAREKKTMMLQKRFKGTIYDEKQLLRDLPGIRVGGSWKTQKRRSRNLDLDRRVRVRSGSSARPSP
jgi:hypothetical protein